MQKILRNAVKIFVFGLLSNMDLLHSQSIFKYDTVAKYITITSSKDKKKNIDTFTFEYSISYPVFREEQANFLKAFFGAICYEANYKAENEDKAMARGLFDSLNAIWMNEMDENDVFANRQFVQAVQLDYQSQKLICFSHTIGINNGGQYGRYKTTYYTFTLPNYELKKSWRDFFKDSTNWVKYAEKKFRQMHSIPEGTPMASTPYFFGDDFWLCENFTFTRDGMQFCYNAGEIANFDQGLILLKFDYKELEQLLKKSMME